MQLGSTPFVAPRPASALQRQALSALPGPCYPPNTYDNEANGLLVRYAGGDISFFMLVCTATQRHGATLVCGAMGAGIRAYSGAQGGGDLAYTIESVLCSVISGALAPCVFRLIRQASDTKDERQVRAILTMFAVFFFVLVGSAAYLYAKVAAEGLPAS